MKKLSALLLSAICIAVPSFGGSNCDIFIYGGTSAGVIAARSAALQGKTVIIVEPTNHIGGLTTGGLGYTDIGKNQELKGLAAEFYRDIGKHYGTGGGKLVFEPKVASGIYAGYLDDSRITVLKKTGIKKLVKSGKRIKAAVVSGLDEKGKCTGKNRKIKAKVFIDASYEGDLLPLSGVSFTTGREKSSKYGEKWNGFHFSRYHQFPDGVDPYVIEGDPQSGLLWGISSSSPSQEGDGDSLIQAYNLRVCLTDSTENKIPITEPDNYDATRYELLARLMAAQKPDARYFIWSPMPGRKTDINNYGGFSTDMIGMNYDYIGASYERRAQILDAHTDYTKGLFWFILTDPRVPEKLSKEISRWGYPKDEYPENNHWTPQLYVREGRRMVSDYVVTQADCEGKTRAEDGIAEAAYMMDSHNCQRVVVEKDGRRMVKNEGDVEIKIPGPYPISYRAIVPSADECSNLLVPVCLSASHIAYGSIRMEPVFMSLGEVAARAAVQATKKSCTVQEVDWRSVRL